MSAPDRIWAFNSKQTGYRFYAAGPQPEFDNVEFIRADGPTITAYREALRLLGVDPDSIARETEKEAQNG